MNWFGNVIFSLTCYPLLFIMYFIFKGARDKNGWCFGSALSRELKEEPRILEIDAAYRKNLKTAMMILAIIPLPTLFIPYFSISFTIWMFWVLVVCFYPMFFYAQANVKVVEFKKERGLCQKDALQYGELKAAMVPRRVGFLTFLPMLIMSIIPTVLAFYCFSEDGYRTYAWIVAIFAICTVLFYLCAVWTDKQKIAVISEDSDVNLNFARAKKQAWKNFWVLSGWINVLFTWGLLFFLWLREYMMIYIISGSIAYCVVLILIVMKLMKKLQGINKKYESTRTIADATDDDRNWIWGLMYYNPKDKHLMVENRMGTGTTVNMAHRFSKGMYIFSTLLLLIIPISSIWIIMLEFTPIQTKVIENQIVCKHLSVEYEIPLDEIVEYSTFTELPELIKAHGNAMDNVYSGTYEVYREGMFELFLNPQEELFIKIVAEDETYYISGNDETETQEVLEVLEGLELLAE